MRQSVRGWVDAASSGSHRASTGPARSGRFRPGRRPAPTASPGPTPAADRPPAIRRARSWTSRQVCRTGSTGSPVTMPLLVVMALWNIFSVNRLTTASSGSGAASSAQSPGFLCSACGPVAWAARPHEQERFGLESVIRRCLSTARRSRWAIRSHAMFGRSWSPRTILNFP